MGTSTYQADTLQIEIKDDYAIVQLDNGKVNAINIPLVKDLARIFNELDNDSNVKGAILTGRPHAFSGGLDIVSIATYTPEQGIEFWENYMYAMQSMVKFSKPLVCAITGYAPAGATILTLCTDYRVMGKGQKHVIGMHEFKLQMQIPEMLCDVYAYYLGENRAWKAVQNARLFNSDEALKEGLVDESVDVEDVLERAEKHLKKQMGIYGKVFHQSKQFFRKGLYKIVMERDVPQLARNAVEFSDDPFLKGMVEAFMNNLKKKK